MKLSSILAVATLMVTISGCGNKDMKTTGTLYAPAASLAAYRTWAWSPNRSLVLRDPTLNTPVVRGWVESAVDAELVSKGYAKASAGTADLLVSYSAASRQMLASQKFSADDELSGSRLDEEGSLGAALARTRNLDTDWEEGYLNLDLLDRKNGKRLYRGTTRTAMLKQPSPDKSVTRINRMAKNMLKNLPSR